MRRLRAEDALPVGLGQDAGPPGMDQQVGVPGREEPNRDRDVLVRPWRIGQVDQFAPVRVTEPAKVERREGRLQGGCLEPGPARDIGPAGRPEPREVAPDEVDDRGRLVDRRLAQPLFGQGVAVGAALLPCP